MYVCVCVRACLFQLWVLHAFAIYLTCILNVIITEPLCRGQLLFYAPSTPGIYLITASLTTHPPPQRNGPLISWLHHFVQLIEPVADT